MNLYVLETPTNEAVEDNEEEQINYSIDDLLLLLQQLPDKYRLVFNLYVLDGYTHQDIAEMLKISAGTSKSNLHRARQLLKDKLEIHHKKVNNG